MADAKIDKSLDDIIKERKISTRRGGSAGLRGGRGMARGSRRGGPIRRSLNGGVVKRRSAGATGISPSKAASINGQWNHDLYGNGPRRSASAYSVVTAAAQAATSLGPAKLVISNLDYGVNDSDIKGLFQEFGNIRRAAVHYDRSARSLGTADVLFDRRQDAVRALKKYNGVSLDGRPMNIQFAAPLETSATVVSPVARQPPRGFQQRNGGPPKQGGGRGFRPRGGRGGRGAGGRPRGGRGGGAGDKPAKSAADLDADLDAYTKMQTD